MTGLDVFKNKIIECACVLTNHDLTTVIQGPHIIIHVEKEELD